jgi:hypothetical protein
MRLRIFVLVPAIATICVSAWATAASAFEWHYDGVTAQGVPFTATSTLEFKEQGPEAGALKCAMTQKGSVTKASGTITKVTLSNCKGTVYHRCESAIEVEALHLPWKSSLVSVGGGPRYQVENSGSGEPQWYIRCNGPLGKQEGPCDGPETGASVTKTSAGVTTYLDNLSRSARCSFAIKPFTVRGGEAFEEPVTGHHFSVPMPEWLLNTKTIEGESGAGVTTKGNVKLHIAQESQEHVQWECSDTVEGQVGPGGGRQVNAVTFTNCKGAAGSVCESGTKLTARHLPWRTELETAAGVTREVIGEGEYGAGAPRYELICNTFLGPVEKVCTGSTSAAVSAVTGGVDEIFDSKSAALNCGGGFSAVLEGTNLIENPGANTLTFKA